MTPNPPKCPNCNRIMALRTARTGRNAGGQFWGCRGYPACKATVPFVATGSAPVANIKRIDDKMASKYQRAIFRALVKTDAHLVIEAVAGSGKTSTIVEGMIRWCEQPENKGKHAVFLAFNQAIAGELGERVKSAGIPVEVRTTHSFGLAAVRRACPTVEIDRDKLTAVFDTVLPLPPEPEENAPREELEGHAIATDCIEADRRIVSKLAARCKDTLCDVTPDALRDLDDFYGLDIGADADGWERLADLTQKTLDACKAMMDRCDFDDMLWLPIVNNLPLPTAALVMVDESQDLNSAQHAMLERLAAQGARIVAVGDTNQAIYGFRGARVGGMADMASMLKATGKVKHLPLSVTYRCPRAHVALAQQIVPGIDAAPKAIMGEVVYEPNRAAAVAGCVDGDLIVCRVNAPLIGTAFDLIRMGKRPVIKGRDFADGLARIIRECDKGTIALTLVAVDEWVAKMREKFRAVSKRHLLMRAEDQYETIYALAEGATTPRDMLNKLYSIFSDDATGIILATVHGAKGLEADTVVILAPEKMPHPMASKEWERDQERNIQYVAFTRAKRRLVFVATEAITAASIEQAQDDAADESETEGE
jgi:superfamily I DNA/RNA helicase